MAFQPEPNKESFVVDSSTQVSHFVKDMLALVCGVPDNSLRCVAPDVGGGFGSKLNVYAEEAQALYEEVIYDESGNPVTGSKASYTVLGTPKIPTSSLTRRRAFSDQSMGVKGIDESGVTGPSAAAVNVAIDALSHEGVTHVDMFATPWKM